MKTLESVNVTDTAHYNQLGAWNDLWVEYEIADALSMEVAKNGAVEEAVLFSNGTALLVNVVEEDCRLVAICFSFLRYLRQTSLPPQNTLLSGQNGRAKV